VAARWMERGCGSGTGAGMGKWPQLCSIGGLFVSYKSSSSWGTGERESERGADGRDK